ncbi:MAG: carboxylesterase family protein [Lachnospiraceae bacterium]|nr:carboxylesterase family protein [Lachnospiraceae bacterium]
MVQTKYGKVEGQQMCGYTVYKGIPYAKPPVGALRWKAPQEPDCWEGVYEAKTFGNMAPQTLPEEGHPIMGRFKKEFYSDEAFIPKMSEDCLYLNIWAPDQTGEKLPVAFWIHGGGFGGGYGSEMEFDGEAYCSRGVILVTVNYRVGIFGFLAHPWLTAESRQGISGNYGILDQIAALNWVWENIEAFGGDPENITVFGQSAGSMSTQVLVSSPLTKGRIAKAILQSGLNCELGFAYTPTLAEEEQIGEMFVESVAAKSLEELRSLSVEQIMEGKGKLDAKTWEMGKGIVVVPNVDGYVLTDTVDEVYQKGTMHRIPYMAGCVTDDLGTKPEELADGDPGDILKECRAWCIRQEEAGNPQAFAYHFARRLPGDEWGAFHSAELWYTFGTLHRSWRPMEEQDDKISRNMLDCWTGFMKTGNPNGVKEAGWKPCTRADAFVKVFC